MCWPTADTKHSKQTFPFTLCLSSSLPVVGSWALLVLQLCGWDWRLWMASPNLPKLLIFLGFIISRLSPSAPSHLVVSLSKLLKFAWPPNFVIYACHTGTHKFCMFVWCYASCQIVYEIKSRYIIHTLHTISTHLSLQHGKKSHTFILTLMYTHSLTFNTPTHSYSNSYTQTYL